MVKEPIIKSDLNKILMIYLGQFKYVEYWWDSVNEVFDNLTPREVYDSSEEGRQRVINYVMSHVNEDYC
jgi:hypothetical protein